MLRVHVSPARQNRLQVKALLNFLWQIILGVESYSLIPVVSWFGFGLNVENYLEQAYFFTPQ